MIPTDREELDILAGEFVLGLLDATQAREVTDALAGNPALQDAVTFWEQKLHPLLALAVPADPPAGTWQAILERTQPAKPAAAPSRGSATPWKWATGAFAAAAAALIIYLAVPASAPSLVAGLHSPSQQAADWIATVGPKGLHLAAVSQPIPPASRVFELWAIAKKPGSKPRALGVIPENGNFQLAALPQDVGPGATLAISVEPPGGSPTGSPTGPVVFVGVLRAS